MIFYEVLIYKHSIRLKQIYKPIFSRNYRLAFYIFQKISHIYGFEDSVPREEAWKALVSLRILNHLILAIKSIYKDPKGIISAL